MPKVIADITMSLDGYVTGPGADEQAGLGDAPELHLGDGTGRGRRSPAPTTLTSSFTVGATGFEPVTSAV
jgi:hypothetical protein